MIFARFDHGRQGGFERCFVAALVAIAACGALCEEAKAVVDPADRAQEIALASGLDIFSCELDFTDRLPVFFGFGNDGGLREAVFSAVVPASPDVVVDILEDTEGYPSWFLQRADGLRNLYAFEVGPDGSGYLQVVGPDGLRLETAFETIAGEEIRGVHVRLTPGRSILTGDLTLAVWPLANCGSRASLIVGSLSWRMGWLGRLLPLSIKTLPGALALSIRDQLMAHVLSSDESFIEGLIAESSEDQLNLRLLTLRPLVLSGEGRALRSSRLEDFLMAVSGSYSVTRWQASFQSSSGDISSNAVGAWQAGNLYELELVLERRGYSLTKVWKSSKAEVITANTAP